MAYRADIEIAVRGAQELKRLQNAILVTSDAVDSLNSNLSGIANLVPRSFDNLNRTVAQAARSFNAAALGTKEATDAAREYVRATDAANAGLRERIALLAKVQAEERRTVPGDPNIIRQIEGSASAAARNRLAAGQEARRTAAPEVPRRLISGVAAPQGMAPGNAPVSTAMQGPLAGPGAMGFPVALALSKVEQQGLETAAKKQAILQRMAATKQALVGLAANLQRLDQNSAVAIADAVRSQLQLNAAKLKELNTTQQIRATEAAASKAARQRLSDAAALRNPAASKKGGFLSELSNPSSKLGSAVIGGGFPALMGGGPGAIAGGAIGGAVGGFAGSIAVSAIGQALDTAMQKVKELGDALNELNIDKLRGSSILVTAELDRQVTVLKELGNAEAARAAIASAITEQTGASSVSVDAAANAVALLQESWNEVYATVSVLVATLGAPFAVALAVILKGVNLVAKGWNLILGEIGKLFPGMAAYIEQNRAVSEELEKQKAAAAAAVSLQVQLNAQTQNAANREIAIAVAKQQGNEALTETLTLEGKLTEIRRETAKRIQEAYVAHGANATALVAQLQIEGQIAARKAAALSVLQMQTIEYTKQRTELQHQAQLAQGLVAAEQQRISMGASLVQARSQAEISINNVILQRLNTELQSTSNAQQRQQIIQSIYNVEVATAAATYRAAVAQIQAQTQLVALVYQEQQLKLATLEVEKALAVARGQQIEEFVRAAELQQQAVALAAENLTYTQAIAAEQIRGANATYQAAVEAAKLKTETTGAAQAAATFANNMQAGAQATQQVMQATKQIAQASQSSVGTNAERSASSMALDPVKPEKGGRFFVPNFNSNSFFEVANMRRSRWAKMSDAAMAEGGFVTRPTNALIGEGGEAEYVIPASKMSEAMARYGAGARGSGVIPNGVNPQVNITTGPVTQMNGTNYITQRDLMYATQTAAKEGASIALKSLQSNPALRRSVGLAR